MRLKELELSGFKSFAKKTSLIFDSPITAIVGPNGSGKSNVAEAFRWVLGEQSLKSLRGKRGEDLIFNGAQNTARLNKASAKVFFDNSDRKVNIDFDQVIIERSVFRDGANEYSLNNSKVRLKDVLELLSSVSLGATGHHIISQGEADKILNATISERRLIIEEALGLKIYQWKIAESEKKLDKTEENIRQVESLRREIAPHIKFLQKQVEKIEKADELRRELKALYLEYLKKQDLYLKNFEKKISLEKNDPTRELSLVEEKFKQLNESLAQSNVDSEKLKKISETEGQLRNSRYKKDELSRQLGRLEGMIEIKSERVKTASEETFDQVVDYSQVANLIKNIENFVATAEQEDDLSAIKNTLFKIKDLLTQFSAGHHKVVEPNQAWIEELATMKEEKEKAEIEMKRLADEDSRLTIELEETKTQLEKEKEDTRGAEREIFELRSRRSELRSQLEAIRAREEKFKTESDEFKRELTEAVTLVDREILGYETYDLGSDYQPEADRASQEERRRKIERIKIRLEDMGIDGTDVLEEFKEATERDEFLMRELEDLFKSAESLKVLIRDLKEKIDTEFQEGVKKINKEFQNFFSLMFGGGTAMLEVVIPEKKKAKSDMDISDFDSAEVPVEDEEIYGGIDVNISLPRKKIRGLQMLSGGERALTSIALLFAMSQVNPPPFLILDETDAALDEANSRKYGEMIENLSKYSQLILITHNRETMSRAGIIYGVTMGGDGISKLLSIKFDEAATWAK